MRTACAWALIGLVAGPPFGRAQSIFSTFNGTWRPDPQVFSPTRAADVVELAHGVYDCKTCAPPYKIPADGKDHALAGIEYYDSLSVTVVDERSVLRIAKKTGKKVAETKSIVAPDGKSKIDLQTVYDAAPRPIEMTAHSLRVSGGPPGSHLISGAWRMTDAEVSNHAEDTIFKVTGDTLSMSDRMGRSFSAKLDGTEAPYKGSEQFTSVSLSAIDRNTIEETDKKGGQVVKVSRWEIGPDGKSMHVTFVDAAGHVQEQTGHKVDP